NSSPLCDIHRRRHNLVRITGLEPARVSHQNLNLARLPIPPYPPIIYADAFPHYFIKKVTTTRVMRIELTYLAWKASVLPLNYTRRNIGVTGFEPAAS